MSYNKNTYNQNGFRCFKSCNKNDLGLWVKQNTFKPPNQSVESVNKENFSFKSEAFIIHVYEQLATLQLEYALQTYPYLTKDIQILEEVQCRPAQLIGELR